MRQERLFFFFSSRRRHTRWNCDWSSDVCSSDLGRERLHWLGSAVVEAARESAGPPDAKGWVTVEVPIESVEQAAIHFLQLGTEAEVLKPKELRRRLAACAREMAKIN